MDWLTISKTYPTAYRKMFMYFQNSNAEKCQLYDFFDSNDLLIEISVQKIDGGSFQFCILNDGTFYSNEVIYKTRDQVETDAFLMAFRMMEGLI